jgi:hypothetical protein
VRVELERAEGKKWTELRTRDESRVFCKNLPKGCWLSLEEDLAERVRQKIGPEKSMFTGFSIRDWSIQFLPLAADFGSSRLFCFSPRLSKMKNQEVD